MRLLIIRHGDPDYKKDSLTEKGWREARFLAQRMAKIPAQAYYCSPLGRAKDTASLTLEAVGRTAQECPWLREFEGIIHRPDREGAHICWDWLPQGWTGEARFFSREHWLEQEAMAGAGMVAILQGRDPEEAEETSSSQEKPKIPPYPGPGALREEQGEKPPEFSQETQDDGFDGFR